jgi:hypothetical protein
LNSGEFLSVAIKKGKSEFCADAALVGEQIYIFPVDRSQGLLKFDIEKLRLSEVPDFVKTCETATSLDDDILLCRISEESNRIYFALYKTDVVGYFDKITEKTKIYHTGIDDIFSCFVSDDICWIITNHGGDVYRFDFMHKPELVHEESNKYRSTRRFNRIFRYAGKIWLLPAYPGTVLSIDVDSIIDEYDTYCGLEEDKICLFGSANVNGEEWLLPFGKCDLYKIGIDGSILKKFPFILVDEKSKKQIISGIIQQRDGLVSEDNSIGLKDFLITL